MAAAGKGDELTRKEGDEESFARVHRVTDEEDVRGFEDERGFEDLRGFEDAEIRTDEAMRSRRSDQDRRRNGENEGDDDDVAAAAAAAAAAARASEESARSKMKRFEERREKCVENLRYGFKDVLAALYVRNHFDVSGNMMIITGIM